MENIADLRKSYELAALDESQAPLDPLELFRSWFQYALQASVPEPNAMTLATVNAAGQPSARIVLVKEFNERGLVWFTNYQSRKGQDLHHQSAAALQFHWVELERVVRIEGKVHKIAAQESNVYFHSRPLGSRLGACASPQSSVVASRADLEAAMERAQATYGEAPPRPEHWGGYRLVPHYWEFWQGRPSRLHDRLRYRREADDSAWCMERLAP